MDGGIELRKLWWPPPAPLVVDDDAAAESRRAALGPGLFELGELGTVEIDKRAISVFMNIEAARKLCGLLPSLLPEAINPEIAAIAGRSSPRLAAVVVAIERARAAVIAAKIEEARIAALLALDLWTMAEWAAGGRLSALFEEAAAGNAAISEHVAYVCGGNPAQLVGPSVGSLPQTRVSQDFGFPRYLPSPGTQVNQHAAAIRASWKMLRRGVVEALAAGRFVGQGRDGRNGERKPILMQLWPMFHEPKREEDWISFGGGKPANWDRFYDVQIFTKPSNQSAGKKRMGRPRSAGWPAAKEKIMGWLEEDGFPGPGEQAAFERRVANYLAERGYDLGESTIGRYVQECVAEYQSGLGMVVLASRTPTP